MSITQDKINNSRIKNHTYQPNLWCSATFYRSSPFPLWPAVCPQCLRNPTQFESPLYRCIQCLVYKAHMIRNDFFFLSAIL